MHRKEPKDSTKAPHPPLQEGDQRPPSAGRRSKALSEMGVDRTEGAPCLLPCIFCRK